MIGYLNLSGKTNNTLHPSQIGFVPGNRTSDHIFSLRTLIDKYVLNTTKGKLFGCFAFVDFRKAFDSIWHPARYLSIILIDSSIILYQIFIKKQKLQNV